METSLYYQPDLKNYNISKILLRVEVGSGAHGTGDPGHDDVDHMAIALESPEVIFGLSTLDTITYRPGRGPEDPSGPGDLDLVIYPLKKFASLAAAANPSILMLFWSKPLEATEEGLCIQESFPHFLSKRIFNTHIGYAQSQHSRLKRGKYYASRKPIVDKYGWDTKYGMHALRLLLQGIELATTGKITLPIPNPNGDLLREVRAGKYSEKEFSDMFDSYLDTLKSIEKRSNLSSEPDIVSVNKLLRGIYFGGMNLRQWD